MPKKKIETVPEENKLLCGLSQKEVREKYFKGELKDVFTKILAVREMGIEEIDELKNFLEFLREEERDFLQKMGDSVGRTFKNDNPPTVQDLQDGVSDEEWRDKAKQAYEYIEKTLDDIRARINKGEKIPSGFWSRQAEVFLSMQSVIEKDSVFKEQLYRARMADIIDTSEVSRKEAEERARLTKEYFDYKVVDMLLKRLEEFYTFARREDDKQNFR